MFGLQPLHWLIIIVVAIVFFAPMRVPQLIRAIKQSLREFGAGVKETGQEPSQDKNKKQ